ncbi:MAG: LysM peptidoglycan-binding domain-containing protein [Bdellovibrionia bacterium]
MSSSYSKLVAITAALLLAASPLIAQDEDEFEFFDEEPAAESPAESPAAEAPAAEKSIETPAASAEAAPVEPVDIGDSLTEIAEPPPPQVTEEAPQFEEVSEGADEVATQPEEEVVSEPTEEVAAPNIPEEETVTSESVATGNQMFGSDDPDLEQEQRFHEIYRRYNVNPTPQEAWNQASSAVTGEYGVQKGDTLWSISKTLFGDSEYWPKVWSLNTGAITNPHEIKPGMAVSFTAGTFSEPPEMSVEEKGMSLSETVTIKDEEGNIKVVPKKIAKLLKQIPPSLPEYRNSFFNKGPDLGFEVRKRDIPPAQDLLSFYVDDRPAVGVGRVTETEFGGSTAAENQYVFIKLKRGTIGQRFLALKNAEAIKLGKLSNSPRAFMVEVQGVVEVVNQVNAQENLFRAMVVEAQNPIEVQSLLVPGMEIPRINTQPGPVNAAGNFRVIGGQFDRERFLLGDRSLIFVNGGRSRGVSEGQVYNIYGNQRLRNKGTKAITGDRVIGQAKVVRVSELYSTLYVLSLAEDMYVGDYLGGESSIMARDNSTPDDNFDF